MGWRVACAGAGASVGLLHAASYHVGHQGKVLRGDALLCQLVGIVHQLCDEALRIVLYAASLYVEVGNLCGAHILSSLTQTLKENVLNGEAYEVSKCETIEVLNEGMLCTSGDKDTTYDPFTGGGKIIIIKMN